MTQIETKNNDKIRTLNDDNQDFRQKMKEISAILDEVEEVERRAAHRMPAIERNVEKMREILKRERKIDVEDNQKPV